MLRFFLIFNFNFLTLFSQNYSISRTIDSLSILNNYSEALKLTQLNPNNKGKFFYYNKACLFSQLNEIDSTEYYINFFLKIKTGHYDIWYDYSLENFRKSNKWKRVDSILNYEFEAENPNIKNPTLAKKILRIGIIDQNYRGKLISTEKIFSNTSEIFKKIKAQTDSLDKTTEIFIQKILDSCNFWPGISYVGKKSNHYGVLLYQHTENNCRKKNYVFMKEAFRLSEINNNEFAMITDRVRIGKGKPQIYGTQFKMGEHKKLILSGKINIKKINKNREKIGLPALKQDGFL